MIHCEHFIRGSFHKVGYRTLPSPNLRDLLSSKTYVYLQSFMGSNIRQTLLEEGYVAITKLTPTKDEYGRDTVWNHTILVAVKDYLWLAWNNRISAIFEPHFIKPFKTGGDVNLQPIEIEEKT